MSKKIIGKQFDEERALYHLTEAEVVKCKFAGKADGESALKETENIRVADTLFALRYPLWHTRNFVLDGSTMEETARAALWYADFGEITKSVLHGIKAVRECSNITLKDCDVDSAEFGWKSRNIRIANSKINSEYLLLGSQDIVLENVRMTGKYSFQYTENLAIANSNLDTKDAFWHSRNVTVKNSVVKGEYLGWYSEGLTLIGCRIIGTQPLCYCKNLKLIDCTMEGCDLAFEYSEVEAKVKGSIDSVKNPKAGVIEADAVGEIIRDNPVMECTGEVRLHKDVV